MRTSLFLAAAGLASPIAAIKIYGVAPDMTALRQLRYHQDQFPNMDFDLILSNETTDFNSLDLHEYDLSNFDPLPYYDPITLDIHGSHTSRALNLLERGPVSGAATCHTESNQPTCGSDFFSSSDNVNFVCHTLAGLAGISGTSAAAVILNNLTCGKFSGWQLVLQVSWAAISVGGAAAATSYCPTALGKLSSCPNESQLVAHSSDPQGNLVFTADFDQTGYVTCKKLDPEYGTGFRCAAESASGE